MKIILSPAKQMRRDADTLPIGGYPVLLERAEEILHTMRCMSYDALKALWGCNDKLAEENFELIASAELRSALTPAILAYHGIAYQYMAPGVFDKGQFAYVQEHLRILSGLYGVLCPMDGVVPYRLEMQAKLSVGGCRDLYDYWGDRLCREVTDESRCIVNLASKEYSRCIEPYLTPQDRFITCIFAEEEKGRLVQKGVYAKMARGEMVRYMAELAIEDPAALRGFDRLGFRFSPERSNECSYVFLRQDKGGTP